MVAPAFRRAPSVPVPAGLVPATQKMATFVVSGLPATSTDVDLARMVAFDAETYAALVAAVDA